MLASQPLEAGCLTRLRASWLDIGTPDHDCGRGQVPESSAPRMLTPLWAPVGSNSYRPSFMANASPSRSILCPTRVYDTASENRNAPAPVNAASVYSPG